MSAQTQQHFTPEQYLEMERKAVYKSEYFRGEIFAMAGAKPRHNRITGNLNILIGSHLWKKRCQVFGSDQRVLTATEDGLYSYPDLSIVCGPPRFTDLVSDTIINPTIIVEVLSKGTEGYDRGEKFRLYRRLPTFVEYLLVDSRTMQVEVHRKNEEGIWSLMSEAEKPEQSVYLQTIDLPLLLSDIYEGWADLPANED
ncbi:Uma2 family endonuclease [Runella salmonicolor]|uniref:Uma2 family endonuclease n=1 Tax=Runella salmonicolor TaxID=2950278 RepID=A0ABT1G0H1_9BACT|nr:Uma2 family endonuclease [Runella salmonicolor]MCP1386463.1 Uma2 family endonuclease [Runella salmonicolor]